MLVTAIAILVSDRITLEQLQQADELLDNFCKLMSELYGEYNLSINFQFLLIVLKHFHVYYFILFLLIIFLQI